MEKIGRNFIGESCHICYPQYAVPHTHRISEPFKKTDITAIPAQSVFFPRFIQTETFYSTQSTLSSNIAVASFQQPIRKSVKTPLPSLRSGRI